MTNNLDQWFCSCQVFFALFPNILQLFPKRLKDDHKPMKIIKKHTIIYENNH